MDSCSYQGKRIADEKSLLRSKRMPKLLSRKLSRKLQSPSSETINFTSVVIAMKMTDDKPFMRCSGFHVLLSSIGIAAWVHVPGGQP